MSKYRFNRVFLCPWCSKGKFLADGKGKVTVSIQCPKCGRYFVGDLDTSKTERTAACKSQMRG